MLRKIFASFGSLAVVLALFTLSCSAQQSEADVLRSIREATASGKLPPESLAADAERRFAGTRTGALAKLLRGRIKFESNDFAGAAAVLDSPDIARFTKLGDYALWLRGKSLQSAGDHAGAIGVFETLLRDYPNSLRTPAGRLRMAESMIAQGRQRDVATVLRPLMDERSAEAFSIAAKAMEAAGDAPAAATYYRKAYIHGGTGDFAKEAETKLKAAGASLEPANAEEALARADRLLATGAAKEAFEAYTALLIAYPQAATADVHLARVKAAARAKDAAGAQSAFNAMPVSAAGHDKAFYEVVVAYAKAKSWPQARNAAEQMREKYPASPMTVKAWVDAGYAARDARIRGEEQYFLRTALVSYPQAVEVAGAQFELAWIEHESKDHARAADMLTEHLARYADKDTSNRGRAGYWAARNSELAGKIAEACLLYDAVAYRYGANWYGTIGLERLTSLRSRGQCRETPTFPSASLVPVAAENLKKVTVAAENAGPNELERAEKSDGLSTIGLFDWALEELKNAQRTAQNSPTINLALAKHYQMRGDNVNALLSLAKSYPDYSQMFPEEMGREEWQIFYPHTSWNEIAKWARARNLDIYNVAGLIRQESVFNPKARSSANAYGLMQLLVPTAQMMARKNSPGLRIASGSDLYDPAVNIELGTAYMREQLDKYGRLEYMAVAYNAGPGRVVQWRRSLPIEMDEFVEAIPFRETKGYVQGIVRNTAQYRRLYDENGNFKANVGSRPIRAALDTMPREQFAAEFGQVSVE